MILTISFHVFILLLLSVFFIQGIAGNPWIQYQCDVDSTPHIRSCDFDISACRWSSISIFGKPLKWKRVESVTAENGNTISRDWTMTTRQSQGSFMTLDVSTNVKDGTTSQLGLELYLIPPNGGICISFSYATVGVSGSGMTTITPTFDVYIQRYQGRKEKLSTIQIDTQGFWKSTTYATCIGKFDYILFEASKQSKDVLIAVDHVMITQSKIKTCPKPKYALEAAATATIAPPPLTTTPPRTTTTTPTPTPTPTISEEKGKENPKTPTTVDDDVNEAASNTADDDDNDDDDADVLSEGAKTAMIIIGVVFLVIIILVALICYQRGKWCCQDSRRSEDEKKSDRYKDYKMEKVETND